MSKLYKAGHILRSEMGDLIRSDKLVPVQPDYEALSNEIALEFLPDTGPCGFCDSEIGARHRIADAIVGRILGALVIDNE